MADREKLLRAAALELAAGLVVCERPLVIAEDWSSPNYRPDSYERGELRHELARVKAWRTQHAGLVEWATHTGRHVARRGPSAPGPGRW